MFIDNPDRRIPYTHQVSAGYERQLRPDLSVSADYIHAFGRDLFMTTDLNAGVRRSTSRTATIDRPNPNFVRSRFQRINAGETDYDALQLQLEKRFSRSYSVRAA